MFVDKRSSDGRRNTCKECFNKRRNEIRKLNPEKASVYSKKYYKNNKELCKLKRRNKRKDRNEKDRIRRATDSIFKLKLNIKVLIGQSIKRKGFGKKGKTIDILGCTYEEFKNHMESKFENWMNWSNSGFYNGEYNYGWDIDHIIPISSAKTEEDVIKLNHYSNLQPLCSKINREIKKNKINKEDWQSLADCVSLEN